MKKTLLFLVVLCIFSVCAAYGAETIGGVSLGMGIEKAVQKWGKPQATAAMKDKSVKYTWKKGQANIMVLAKNDRISFIHATTDIGTTTAFKNICTSKGVCLGGPDKPITSQYGKARFDYAYETEDSFVPNYRISKDEDLVFRVYGFGKNGPVVIDMILCKPGFPKDKIWNGI